MFEFFNLGHSVYARRIQTMLREARFAQLEHAAAAEHHEALARMYGERVLRLEALCNAGAQPDKAAPAGPSPVPAPTGLELQRGERAPFRVLTQTPPSAQAAQ